MAFNDSPMREVHTAPSLRTHLFFAVPHSSRSVDLQSAKHQSMMAAMPCVYCDTHAFASAHKPKNLFGENFTALGVKSRLFFVATRVESSFNRALVARMGASETTRVGTMVREDQQEEVFCLLSLLCQSWSRAHAMSVR